MCIDGICSFIIYPFHFKGSLSIFPDILLRFPTPNSDFDGRPYDAVLL